MYTGWSIINIVRLYVVNFLGLDISISKMHQLIFPLECIVLSSDDYGHIIWHSKTLMRVYCTLLQSFGKHFFLETIHQRGKSFIPEPRDKIITKDEEIKKYAVNRKTISRTLRQATRMNQRRIIIT